MKTEVNTFFAVLFVCSFLVSVAFTNEEYTKEYKGNIVFDDYTNPPIISAASSTNGTGEAYENIAPPLTDTSSMHGKNGEFEIYHKYIQVKPINLKQNITILPTPFFHLNKKIQVYLINKQLSSNFKNQIGYFSTYTALERHYLEQNSSK